MQLQELFEVQAGLKKHIGYTGKDKFSKMMLAMLVEFMECANDWQGFKYWKKDNAPKTEEDVRCAKCDGSGNVLNDYVGAYEPCEECQGFGYLEEKVNKLLEEYVDGLHFVLETGLDLHEMGYLYKLPTMAEPYRGRSLQIHEQYQQVLYVSLMLQRYMNDCKKGLVAREYMCLLEDFLELGRLLGFNEEDIYKAYMEKNKENHDRQERGY